MIYKQRFENFDFTLLLVALCIFCIGLLSIYSATRTQEVELSKSLVTKQLISIVISLVVFTILVSFDYQKYIDFSYFIYAVSLFLLVLVLFIGRTKFGAQRWFNLGPFTFQPSEFAKLALVITLASHIGKRRVYDLSLSTVIMSILLTIPMMFLIAIEPDLGTALVLAAILFSMLYMGGIRLKHLVSIMLTGLVSLPIFWHYALRDYQKQRLLVFLNPNADPLGAGYTIIQSKIAIGSGWVFGKGWLAGTQNQLNFLPERHSDFIFSIIGEEWGFLGSAILVLLYFILIKHALSIYSRTNDSYGQLMVSGIVGMLAFQIVVNIAMTLGLMPVVGIPLPLMSYGGSSLIITMSSIALLINIGMRRTVF
ncbi:MAG: rod shape-determining protein RodA [Candidatus Omnitrophica bacterium CG07_land_8_20_14_0_80_42_15]|uniref:Peptidoglycan glycosyltransferase RodA n=1 Tax=Candidatus Aquitaenariimonas noxiae TaxID=1974741 RepID=A0A2J0KT57_9BACT|nr:MAG: rod shape-determining protein RodA [Candidatus Omnitrophica bacterium CG07_land_8_20_14_0_80_42_15]